MLDLGFVRRKPGFSEAENARERAADILQNFEEMDRERRKFLVEAEARKARRNKVSDEIAILKKQGRDAAALIAEMKQVGAEIQDLDQRAKACDERLRELLQNVAERSHETVPVVTTPAPTGRFVVGASRRNLTSPPRPHWDLGQHWNLGL